MIPSLVPRPHHMLIKVSTYRQHDNVQMLPLRGLQERTVPTYVLAIWLKQKIGTVWGVSAAAAV